MKRRILAQSRLLVLLVTVAVAGAASALMTGARDGGALADGGTTTSSSGRPTLPPVIHAPSNPPSRRTPLVIALHGSGGTPALMESVTGLDSTADRNGFTVAYFDTTPANWGDPANITNIGAFIKQMVAGGKIDPARVYVVGFSLGGYASFRAGCDLSRQVTAIAVVSNAMAPLARKPCKLARPVSELNIAGSRDLFPVHQTPSKAISADQTAAIWRSLNGCGTVATSEQVGPTTETTWNGCDDGSSVGQYIVNGGVHAWPGGSDATGPDTAYDASQAIWDFFARHRAPSAASPPVRLSRLRVTSGSVRASFSVGERTARASARLVAHGRTVAARSVTLHRGSAALLVLPVPRSRTSRSATLSVTLADRYGRKLVLRRSLRLGAG